MRAMKAFCLFSMLLLLAASSTAETPKEKYKAGSLQGEATAPHTPALIEKTSPARERLPRCALLARALSHADASPDLDFRLDTGVASDGRHALTGDLRTDLLQLDGGLDPIGIALPEVDGRRNPALAFGLSAVVPGLGQAYNKTWIRAAIASAIEIGLWTGYFTWRSQGFDGRDAYEIFANRDWSPARYGNWLNDYPGYTGSALDVESIQGIDFMNPASWTADEQLRISVFFDELRMAERVSRYNNADGTGTGATFSHVLPDFGEQQYYELIGKYYQYGAGWSDWCDGRDPDDASCLSIEGFEQRDLFAQKTSLFFEYAADHADANTLLRRASRITSFVVANHALAALDALLTARFRNRGLVVESGVSLRQGVNGSVSPVANLRMTF